jgi:hypothetical protein
MSSEEYRVTDQLPNTEEISYWINMNISGEVTFTSTVKQLQRKLALLVVNGVRTII